MKNQTNQNMVSGNQGSAIRTIQEMFDKTDKNGELLIPEWPADCEETPTGRYFQCKMDWNQKGLEQVISDFEELYASLLELGEKMRDEEFDPEFLSADLKATWNTYIRDFEFDDLDDLEIEQLLLKEEFEELTEAEQEAFDEYMGRCRADAEQRLEKPLAALQAVNRARRFCKLKEIDAPLAVLWHEADYLAQAFVVNACAKSMRITNETEI